MKEVEVIVEGMMCGGCEARIQNALKAQKEVQEVKADQTTGKVVITLNEDLEEKVIREKIENLGFGVKEIK